jgi:hypothetical protein
LEGVKTTEAMKVELFGVEEINKRYLYRYWRSIRWFVLLFILFDIGFLVKFGPGLPVFIVGGGLLLIVVLYGLYTSANVLYKVYLDEENDLIEIETLHYGSVRTLTRNRKDVRIKVIQDATSRYIIDMIRIDVDRKTFFTQKQVPPWTRDRIEGAKNIVKLQKL